MVGPDLGVVEIEWGGRRLRLHYPLGAVKYLSEVLETKVEIYELPQLLKKLDLTTLGIWVWAGMLHEDRSIQKDKIMEWVAWSHSPTLPLIQAVNRAFAASVFGTILSDSTEDESPSPKDAETLGRGRGPLASLFNTLRSPRKTSGGGGISPASVTLSKPSEQTK